MHYFSLVRLHYSKRSGEKVKSSDLNAYQVAGTFGTNPDPRLFERKPMTKEVFQEVLDLWLIVRTDETFREKIRKAFGYD